MTRIANIDQARIARDAFHRAVDRFESQSSFAKFVGRTQGAISKRLKAGSPLWPEHVLKVEQATGISRHDLRPDIYPREEQGLAA